jgi:hypothetical protein
MLFLIELIVANRIAIVFKFPVGYSTVFNVFPKMKFFTAVKTMALPPKSLNKVKTLRTLIPPISSYTNTSTN